MANSNVRYGAELRKRAGAVDASKRTAYPCPKCAKIQVRRVSNAVWACRGCGAQYAGGTYALSTPAGEVVERMLRDYSKTQKAKAQQ